MAELVFEVLRPSFQAAILGVDFGAIFFRNCLAELNSLIHLFARPIWPYLSLVFT